MKKIKFLAVAAILIIGTAACNKQKKSSSNAAKKGWTLVWEDDFDKSMDETIWSKMPAGKKNMNRYMNDNDGLFIFQDGNLILRGVKNSTPTDDMPFLTGGITTEGKKTLAAHSRIEVRARMNPVAGTTPYITLLPVTKDENISIDVMERYGIDEFIYQSVSSEYTTTGGMPDNPASSALVGVNPNQYHVYGVERYADSVVFFVNDLRTKKYPRILTEMPGQFPFSDQEYELFIGLRLNKDTEPDSLPVDLFIDWVRYYEPDTETAE